MLYACAAYMALLDDWWHDHAQLGDLCLFVVVTQALFVLNRPSVYNELVFSLSPGFMHQVVVSLALSSLKIGYRH